MINDNILSDLCIIINIQCMFLFIILYMKIAIKRQLKILAFNYQYNKMLYITSSFCVQSISYYLYFIINNNLANNILFSSGLFLIPWLTLTGVFILYLYNFLSKDTRLNDSYINESEKLFIITSMGLLNALILWHYNISLSLTVIAILIGKYIWIDTGINGIKNLIHNIFSLKSLKNSSIHRSTLLRIATIYPLVIISYYTYTFILNLKDNSSNILLNLLACPSTTGSLFAFIYMYISNAIYAKKVNKNI